MGKPNVLLLFADQWRGDCLGSAGHPDVKTPYLDAVAARGVRLSRAYSSVPSCIAARAALLTGLSPRHHGRVGYQDRVPWRYEDTMPRLFTRAGYQTQCVGKMHVHPLRSTQGFESVELHDGYLHAYRRGDTLHCEHQHVADDYFYWMQGMGHKDVTDTGLECNSYTARPWIYDEALHPTTWVTDRSIDFLRRRDRERPFFLMASYVRPHPPYDPPECFLDMYTRRELRLPPIGDWAPRIENETHDGLFGIGDETLRREALAGYYASITHVDYQMGRLLEVLGTEGNLENTVVLFASDHGEMLGDHHYMRKGLGYEGSAHVPMLLMGPGVPKGVVNDRVMELRDIMPTLLSAAGLPIPDTLDGISALDAIASPVALREAIFGEHAYGAHSNHFAVTSRDKFIWYSQSGVEQYFDLEADPREEHNAICDPCHQSRIAELRGMLISELSGREEGYTDGSRLIPGRAARAVLSYNSDGRGPPAALRGLSEGQRG